MNWKRNLFFIWISQFLTMLGMSSIVPFLPLFIRELGVTGVEETASWSGWVFAGPFFISLFMTPLWGSLGDKYGRKIISIRAVLGLGIAQILIGLAQSPTQLLVFRFIQGGLSGFSPAAMAMVAANTPEEKNSYALGLLQTATATGTVIGPLIGGVLADMVGYRTVFFIVASLLIITGIFFAIYVKEEKRSVSGQKRFTLLENAKFIFSKKELRYIIYLILLTSFAFAFIRPIFVLFVEDILTTQKFFTTITGVLYGISGFFTAIAAPLWGKYAQKNGIRIVIIYASVLTGMMYFLHVIVPDAYLLAPVRALLGFGYGGLLPVMFAAISSYTPENRKSGVMGLGSSAQILGNMIGPSLSGISVALAGIKFPFLVSGLTFIIMIIIGIKLKKGQ